MKKILLLIICLLIVTGCGSKVSDVKPSKSAKPTTVSEEVVDDYVDLNNTPIGIYDLRGNNLYKLSKVDKTLVVEQDVDTFQIFPSNEETINLNNSFGQTFHDEWIKYNPNNNIKIGFNIKFTKNDGENVSYNILNPSQTFDRWEYLMNYLYDDYANLGKGFYSHIENDQYNENTLFTAFKMQSSYQCSEIASKIQLTVFTYDSDDDFDSNNEYRGNSYSTLDICINGQSC